MLPTRLPGTYFLSLLRVQAPPLRTVVGDTSILPMHPRSLSLFSLCSLSFSLRRSHVACRRSPDCFLNPSIRPVHRGLAPTYVNAEVSKAWTAGLAVQPLSLPCPQVSDGYFFPHYASLYSVCIVVVRSQCTRTVRVSIATPLTTRCGISSTRLG